jgi:hypothetical protein
VDFVKAVAVSVTKRELVMTKLLSILVLTLAVSTTVSAKEFQDHTEMMDHGDGHLMDMDGAMVMGQNTDTLPGGCKNISAVKEITVHAGHKYAEKFPGTMYAFDTQEYQFEPCTKLTVHFINDDQIRHQWMMHGLPKYLYPKGMFHLEVSGPGEVSGTLILPSDDKTYLVHCDIAQHMEKGMKGQLKIGKGNGDLPSIPGVTDNLIQDDYSDVDSEIPDLVADTSLLEKGVDAATTIQAAGSSTQTNTNSAGTTTSQEDGFISGMLVIGLAIGLFLAASLTPKLKGKTFAESVTYLFELIGNAIILVAKPLKGLLELVFSKTKNLPKN